MFDALGLASFAKTSGSKGLQVYVPLNSDVTFAQTKPFARQVVELFECTEPDLIHARPSRCAPARCSSIGAKRPAQDDRVRLLAARPRPADRLDAGGVERGALRACLGRPHDLAFDAVQVLDRVSRRGDLLAPVLSLVQVLPAAPPA